MGVCDHGGRLWLGRNPKNSIRRRVTKKEAETDRRFPSLSKLGATVHCIAFFATAKRDHSAPANGFISGAPGEILKFEWLTDLPRYLKWG